MILFAVLVACAVAGIYCAFHFGNVRSVEQALITLLERPADPQPKYRSILIPPPVTSDAAPQAEPSGKRSTPSPRQPRKLHETRQERARPSRAPGEAGTIKLGGFTLPNESPDLGGGHASEALPAAANLLISETTLPSAFSARSVGFEKV